MPEPAVCPTCGRVNSLDANLDAVRRSMEEDQKEIDALCKKVEDRIQDTDARLEEEKAKEPQPSFGQRVADKVASFGGSWTFIGIFALTLAVWIGFNALSGARFDPFPFILLNLLLSCLAAIQAPVIMMSQNRQEQRDRHEAENDYKTNLKAELEIEGLHDKMDHMLMRQMRRLLEIQELQVQLLREVKTPPTQRDEGARER